MQWDVIETPIALCLAAWLDSLLAGHPCGASPRRTGNDHAKPQRPKLEPPPQPMKEQHMTELQKDADRSGSLAEATTEIDRHLKDNQYDSARDAGTADRITTTAATNPTTGAPTKGSTARSSPQQPQQPRRLTASSAGQP